MRLPGTLNLISNALPTTDFLDHWAAAKAKRKLTDELKANDPNHVPLNAKNLAAAEKANKNKGKNNNNNNNGNDDKQPDADFTEAQDKALIDLKLKDASWKDIATELGKNQEFCKARFKVVRPMDFEMRLKAAKEEKKAGGGGGGGGKTWEGIKNEGNKGQNQGGGGGGNNEDGGKKGKKNKKGRGKVEQEAEAGAEDSDEEENWWEVEDERWDQEELHRLYIIATEELKNAFGQMSARFAEEEGRKVHPASIAEKILGRKPDW